MKRSDIIPINRIKILMESLNKFINIYDQEKIKNSKNWSLCDMFELKLDYEVPDKTNNKKKNDPNYTNKSVNVNNMNNNYYNSSKKKRSFDLEVKNLIYDFNLGLFESYDETKHFKIDPKNQDKTFDKIKFINDSKNDIKAFLDSIKDRPVRLVF